MLKSRTLSHPKADQLQEVAVYLRQADILVKKGHFTEALEEIQKARTCNPKNLYALAYEERVRSILAARKHNGSSKSTGPNPVDDLEKISNRAIEEAQRTADVAARRQQRIDLIKQQEVETRKYEEQQRAAIRKKVYDLLLKAREYHAHKEFNRALDEIARIHMIDPSNETATALEERIRVDQDRAMREAEAERARRQQEEEKRRKEYMKAELERIKREGEERKRQEEEARLKAQSEKVEQHLKRARKFCDEGQLDDALGELAFVVVIDPLNEEVIELEQRIRELEEEQQAAEIERLEREKLAQTKAREENQKKIQKHIDNAHMYLRQNKFTEAIRVISAAYVVDPLNPLLQKCEAEIFQAREEYLRNEEEERRRQEEEQRQKQEEEMRQLIKSAQKRAQADTQSEQKKEKINEYLEKARKYLENEQFESALGEIALAFVVDPFDKDVQKLEEEIIGVQNQRRNGASGKSVESKPVQKEKGKEEKRVEKTISEESPRDMAGEEETKKSQQAVYHIREARRFKQLKEYHKARNELTKAFMLDPLNEEIKSFEEELQNEYTEQQEEAKRIKATRAYTNRAKQYLAQENFAKALEELTTGLKSNPNDEELLNLKSKIIEAEKRWKEVEELWEKVTSNDRNARSGRGNSKNQYKEALANYYAKLDESVIEGDKETDTKKTAGSQGAHPSWQKVKKKVETEMIDLEDEIRKVYTSWRTEQEQIERGEREAAIQKHIKQAKQFLKEEAYDDALAEVAYAKLIQENRKDLKNLEIEIWNTWNEKTNSEISNRSADSSSAYLPEDAAEGERALSLRIHLRAAEEYAEKKEYTKALDEITKAYLIDPVNDEVSRLDQRIRSMRNKGAGAKELKLVYQSAKAVGGY
jgi:Tfp pilus assembly protein PilF